MIDVLDLFYNLPIELRSKIVYSGYIVHPLADIIKDIKKDIEIFNDTNVNLLTLEKEEPSFYNLLKTLGYLKDTDMLVYIDMDNFLEYILNNHIIYADI